MLNLIYHGILIMLSAVVLWRMFHSKKLFYQIDCALLLIPFILRILRVK